MAKKYPEQLTLDEFDDYPFRETYQFADEKLNDDTIVIEKTQERVIAAQELAKEINGKVYYQIDCGEDRCYSIFEDTWIGIFEVVKL